MKWIDRKGHIVAMSMKETIDNLNTPQVVPHFSRDPEVEAKWVKKMLKAAKRIHNYYTKPSEHI